MTNRGDGLAMGRAPALRSLAWMVGAWLGSQCSCAVLDTSSTPQAYLQIVSDPALGLVVSSPQGIYCNTVCNSAFAPGTQVVLTASPVPQSGVTFVGWSGDCTGTQATCTLTVNSSQTVTASWMPPPMSKPYAPILNLVTPANAINSAASQLTLTGTNFLPGATVVVGGVACGGVHVLSDSQMTCTLPARPAVCGPQSVVVKNSDGQMTMGSLFSYRAAAVAFAPATKLTTTGTGQHEIVAADVNGDGKPDLATANFGSNDVSIFLNAGTGAFGAATSVAVGSGPVGLAAGDEDKDNKRDLVVANATSSDLSILTSDGKGVFSAAGTVSGLNAPQSAVFGDVNNDGYPDVLVSELSSNNVSVLLGDGMGGLTAQGLVSVGSGPRYLAVADINKDGNLDLITPNTGSNSVSYRPGNGDGTFAAGMDITVGSQPAYAVAVDVNGDKNLDILVANQGTNDVTVLLGNGAGVLTPAQGSPFAVGSSPEAVQVADIDGDGKLDLVTANYGSGDLSILLGDGTGGFLPLTGSPFVSGAGTFGVVTDDFNGDGLLDLASTNINENSTIVRLAMCK